MTGEELEVILKEAQAKTDESGQYVLPEGAALTLYLAHEGVALNVSRVEAMRVKGEIVYARTAKRETFAFARKDLFAIGTEGGSAASPLRRAGFG